MILWTKEGPKRLRFEAPEKTVTVKQVVCLDVWVPLKNQDYGTGFEKLEEKTFSPNKQPSLVLDKSLLTELLLEVKPKPSINYNYKLYYKVENTM